MKVERCVVDTNVLISALLQPSGRTADVLTAIRAAGSGLVFSNETFAELASRLARPKFDRYVDPTLRQRFLSDLASVAEWVSSPEPYMPAATRTTTSSSRQRSAVRPTVSSPATPTSWPSTPSTGCGS